MGKTAGFTLLELIVVIMIVGILAVTAASRYSNQDGFALRANQERLIAALVQAQQLAMSGRTVRFSILSGTSYSIYNPESPSVNYDVGSITYPQFVTHGVTLAPSSLDRNYNNIGVTRAATIVLSMGGDSVSVCLETSGYAHGC